MGKILKFKGKRKSKLPTAWQPYVRTPKQPRLWHGAVVAALLGTLIGVQSLNLSGFQLPIISAGAISNAAGLVVTQPMDICQSEQESTCVVDGDTLRVANERIRLLGIDAPELPGHCARGRDCVAGDPFAATANLGRVLGSGRLEVERVGTDHYGRTLALVTAGGVDVSCAQLKGGFAVYKPQWDNGGKLAARCPASAAN